MTDEFFLGVKVRPGYPLAELLERSRKREAERERRREAYEAEDRRRVLAGLPTQAEEVDGQERHRRITASDAGFGGGSRVTAGHTAAPLSPHDLNFEGGSRCSWSASRRGR